MNITISGSHIDLTEALKNHVHNEFTKIKKLLDSDTHIAVEIGKTTNHHNKGNIFKAEAHVKAPGSDYFVEIIHDDLYTAIKMLANDLSEQIIESKNKQRTLLKRGRAMIKKLLRF
jgi:putative sigma-54 modulation protein